MLFLPIVWAIYFALNHLQFHKTAQCALIVASIVFYGYADHKLCLLLAFSISVNYLLHLGLMRGNTAGKYCGDITQSIFYRRYCSRSWITVLF